MKFRQHGSGKQAWRSIAEQKRDHLRSIYAATVIGLSFALILFFAIPGSK